MLRPPAEPFVREVLAMSTRMIERQFERIGARVKVHPATDRRVRTGTALDIGRDRQGEFFDIALDSGRPAELRVVDSRPRLRHLLLLSEESDGKHKFLCGHDERHWFVAAVPERASVSTVETAFEALKPAVVRQREVELKVKPRRRNRRRNAAFTRQGEWFFVPFQSGAHVDERWIFRNEPISRGGGKPHICDELVRQGGAMVYVCPQYPEGLNQFQHALLLRRNRAAARFSWSMRRANPLVMVRGRVRHADHKTIVLHGWHQVFMNTENQSAAMQHVAFLD